jgi:hypothetical protein
MSKKLKLYLLRMYGIYYIITYILLFIAIICTYQSLQVVHIEYQVQLDYMLNKKLFLDLYLKFQIYLKYLFVHIYFSSYDVKYNEQ